MRVVFISTTSFSFLAQVRLISDGTIASQGRVEVMHKGDWGTLCDTDWDLEDANIVCRQLGYDGAKAAPGKASFGEGTGKIWMNNVQCVGNESAITECEHEGWGITDCSHSSDASAVCNPAGRATENVGPKCQNYIVRCLNSFSKINSSYIVLYTAGSLKYVLTKAYWFTCIKLFLEI